MSAAVSDRGADQAMLAGMDPIDDNFLQPSETAFKRVAKFQPKICPRPKNAKEKKAKSVSYSLPDAVETDAAPVEDKIPHSTSVIPDDADIQLDHKNAGKDEISNLSAPESSDCILSELTSVTGKTATEFRPKPCTKTKTLESCTSGNTNGANDSTSSQWDAIHVNIESLEDLNLRTEGFANEHTESIVDVGLPEGDDVFETIDTAFDSVDCGTIDAILDSNNYIGGKAKFSAVPEDTCNDGQTRDGEEQTQERLDDQSKSKAFEDNDVGKSSRKLRKRTAACQHGVGISENMDVENSDNSLIGECHSDDEHTGDGMPKQKKLPKRSKRQMPDAEKPNKMPKKASEEFDSVEPEPPKKRFPHGTRRGRRQVDKTLLESDYEVTRISIKNLIRLGEYNEKIATKEAALSNNNGSNTGSFPGDDYADEDSPFGNREEEHRDKLRNSDKFNYMTHMAMPQRAKWSKAEIELLYEAIRQFGTDFGLIVQLFPNRTREQVKSKFKLEERKHPLEIRDAMSHRSGDHSHYEKVIQSLQAQAEEDESRQDDEMGDPDTVSQDAANGNEEQGDRPDKEEDGFDSVATDHEKLNDWDEDGIADYNEYGSVKWDDSGSFPLDEEFDEI